MKRLQSNLVGIDEGDVILFSDFEHNGDMWTAEGARVSTHEVVFSEPYLSPPSVHVAMSMWDVSNIATARVDLRAEEITETGFQLVFRTWGDTKIARARANWRAIGEVEHEDNWDMY